MYELNRAPQSQQRLPLPLLHLHKHSMRQHDQQLLQKGGRRLTFRVFAHVLAALVVCPLLHWGPDFLSSTCARGFTCVYI